MRPINSEHHGLRVENVKVPGSSSRIRIGRSIVIHQFSSDSYKRCKKCKGSKTVKDKVRQEIFVEKGMTDRQRIVLAGAGDQEEVGYSRVHRLFF